jgi:hypothetical protein
MEPTRDDSRMGNIRSGARDASGGAPNVAADEPNDAQLGPHAAAILASEHWSLLAARALIWNEAMSRATVFLTVLSASIISLALLADATGFGEETRTLALVLLPVVFLLGIAAYTRLVQINTEEFQLVLAMNRLRHAYLQIEPGLERYFTTGHHDDERGVIATYMLEGPSRKWLAAHFLVNTPTIVATVDAALAAAIVALLLQVGEASQAAGVASGIVAFVVVWALLLRFQLHALRPLRGTTPRFPSPPDLPQHSRARDTPPRERAAEPH